MEADDMPTICKATWATVARLGLCAFPLVATGNPVRASETDEGRNVCYKVEEVAGPDDASDLVADDERVVLNVDRQASLTFPGGYPQTVYTAVGKTTETGENGRDQLMAAAQGTIVVTTKGGSTADYDHGARLGLLAVWVRPDAAVKSFDCTSEQESATPNVWICAVRDQDEGLKLDRATLTLLTRPDRHCGIFPDDVIDRDRQRP
jgi:hypothetical protein